LKARTFSGESRYREILMIAIPSKKRRRGLIWFGAARAIIGIFFAAALACCTATPATAAEDLYRAQTVVTGQGEANRMIGFASCMEDVLIKVSGAERLAGDRRLAAYKSKAKDFVTAFDYRDQFSGKPKRDEQGTRDRPFDLTVDFDKEKIDGVLKALGLKPWLSHRPVLAAFVEMEQGERKFIVSSAGNAIRFTTRRAARGGCQARDEHCAADRGGIGEGAHQRYGAEQDAVLDAGLARGRAGRGSCPGRTPGLE
jgi:hypothetical protein